jgi:hypothetical protein
VNTFYFVNLPLHSPGDTDSRTYVDCDSRYLSKTRPKIWVPKMGLEPWAQQKQQNTRYKWARMEKTEIIDNDFNKINHEGWKYRTQSTVSERMLSCSQAYWRGRSWRKLLERCRPPSAYTTQHGQLSSFFPTLVYSFVREYEGFVGNLAEFVSLSSSMVNNLFGFQFFFYSELISSYWKPYYL